MTSSIKHIACIIGTRPEVIKMAPLIAALKQQARFRVTVINTAQHRHLLDDMLKIFNIDIDIDLNLMQANQSLADLTARLISALDPIVISNQFDMIIAQGDTTTTYVSALISFYQHIPFAHVEAGLRSFNLSHPFPEEANRILVSKLATLHFAPSQVEMDILVKEGVNKDQVTISGNTVIDALLSQPMVNLPFAIDKRTLLVTLHRRESFGEPIKHIFWALKTIALQHPEIQIIYPVHPNPNVNKLAHGMLADIENIHLIGPLPYDQFVTLMKKSYLILSDSGGIQEEAPALNKPVLILRNVTERPLVVQEGLAQLVGSDPDKMRHAVELLLTNDDAYQGMQKGYSPYGDGKAATRITESISTYFAKH